MYINLYLSLCKHLSTVIYISSQSEDKPYVELADLKFHVAWVLGEMHSTTKPKSVSRDQNNTVYKISMFSDEY